MLLLRGGDWLQLPERNATAIIIITHAAALASA